MRLGVNLNGSHHIALQMAGQERRISIAQVIEEMVEQLPQYKSFTLQNHEIMRAINL